MKDNEIWLEEIEDVWKRHSQRLENIEVIEKNLMIERVRKRSMSSFKKILYDKCFITMFCWAVVAYFVSIMGRYTSDWRYMTAYIVFVSIYLISGIVGIIKCWSISRHNILTTGSIVMMRFLDDLILSEKKEIIITLTFFLPLMIITGPIVFAPVKGYNFFEYPIIRYLPLVMVCIVVAIGSGIWYYNSNRMTIQAIKENIEQYTDIVKNSNNPKI